MIDGSVATTGVEALDSVLGGLYWGDNVVFDADDRASVEPFYGAAAESGEAYAQTAYVVVDSDRDEVAKRFPGFAVLDARPGAPLAQPRLLLDAVRKVAGGGRSLVLFDSLVAMAELWGLDVAARFFRRGCPLLLELGAIAYWWLPGGEAGRVLRRDVEEVTQCVLTIAGGRLRISKAEGRPPGVQGTVFRYRHAAGSPELAPAPGAARIGAALHSVRVQRGLSQTDLARMAGVSPSAISQAERGQRGLSLETLLSLSAGLHITLDELLRGEVAPGYRLGRRHDPRQLPVGQAVPLLDDPEAGLRTFVVRLTPGESSAPPLAHKGVELVAIVDGLVQVVLTGSRPVLRRGEVLLAEQSGITSWRNAGEGDALLLWIPRD